MASWFYFCLGFTVACAALLCWPLWRHPTLPRARRISLCAGIFLIFTVGGLALYGWVGMPVMALL